MSPARIAYLHLVRQKFSTLIVLFGIILAVATSGLLLRLYKLSNSRFESLIHTGDAIVGAKSGAIDLLLGLLNFEGDYPEFIPLNLYQTLKSQETVQFEDKTAVNAQFIRDVFPFILFAKAEGARVYATSADFFQFQDKGLPVLGAGNAPVGNNEVAIGVDVAEKLHLKVGDILPAASWLTAEPSRVVAERFKVTGIWKRSDQAWDRVALATMVSADNVLAENAPLLRTPWREKVLHFMLVYLKPGGLPRLQALINQRTVAQAISVEGGFQKLEDLTGSGKELGLLVAVIILLLSFSAVASMMIGRFESMNVQMAVLRALGYSKKELAQMLIYEAVILTLLACVLGAAIDGFLFPWLRTLLGANVPSTEVVSMALWQSWPVWVTVLVGNLVSVLYPIWRISKQNIHLSLRSL